MEILVQFKTAPQRCPYIPSETASLEYRVVGDISEEAYAELLRRGWQRFGREFFRPACPHCAACRSIRIPVDRFLPSRSQRRALQCNTDIRTVVTRPTVTLDHLRLYRDYHADMSRRKGWPPAVVSATEYQGIFLEGDWSFAREFQYYDGERLIGVGLADVVPGAYRVCTFSTTRPGGPVRPAYSRFSGSGNTPSSTGSPGNTLATGSPRALRCRTSRDTGPTRSLPDSPATKKSPCGRHNRRESVRPFRAAREHAKQLSRAWHAVESQLLRLRVLSGKCSGQFRCHRLVRWSITLFAAPRDHDSLRRVCGVLAA